MSIQFETKRSTATNLKPTFQSLLPLLPLPILPSEIAKVNLSPVTSCHVTLNKYMHKVKQPLFLEQHARSCLRPLQQSDCRTSGFLLTL